ncbi:MAG TPA: 50S ribosomal protein L15 [Patescibacteria group bacterium]|nr:50S ribosomal protein L15 [Patescibacteria group bacterium]
MNLAALSKTTKRGKKRIGRGYGSGRGGHTSTRGAKGQKARGKVGLFFQGTKFKKSWLKRLPLVRGKGKLKPQGESVVVNLKYLNLFQADEEVNLASLKAKGILAKILPEETKVKILGEGEIKVPLVVSLPVSRGAQEKIEKAGGKVVSEEVKKKTVVKKLRKPQSEEK